MAGEISACPATKSWLYHPEFPDHWERRPLYSLAEWVNGLTFRNIQFSSTGKPVIKIAEIKGGISGQTKFTQQTFDESVHVRPGDLLFSWSGQPETSIDAFWWRGPDGWLNQHVFRITPTDGVDMTFFYYLLRYLNLNFVGIARNKQTTGLGHVTKRDLENIEAAFPDLPEQRYIAHILGTLDDKIELNRRMNETLEAMARALFKSWFVDFDPVMDNALAAGNPIPGALAEKAARRKALGYKRQPLPDLIRRLFPDRFADSELDEIPAGWKIELLGELLNTVKGRSYKSSELVESDTALVTLKSFSRGGGYRPDGLKSFAGSYKHEQVIKPGELVLACTDVTQAAEVVGRPAMVRRSSQYQTLVASLDTLILRPRDARLTRTFIYFLCGTEVFTKHTYAHTTGTTVLHLANEAVPSFRFALPADGLVQAFDHIAAPILERIQDAELESETFEDLRDTLLPKLISGELRVKDAGLIVDTDDS